MTDEPQSLAEAEEMSFEDRCAFAMSALNLHWNSLMAIASEDVEYIQNAKRTDPERVAYIKSEETRRLLEGMFQETNALHLEGTTRIIRVAWDGGVDLLRTIAGGDAVDFALIAFERERKNN